MNYWIIRHKAVVEIIKKWNPETILDVGGLKGKHSLSNFIENTKIYALNIPYKPEIYISYGRI